MCILITIGDITHLSDSQENEPPSKNPKPECKGKKFIILSRNTAIFSGNSPNLHHVKLTLLTFE